MTEGEKQSRYEARWVGYHVLLCLGVWGIFACTFVAMFRGWGP